MPDDHKCKFEDKIIELYGDIKEVKTNILWLVSENKIRNGYMDKHLEKSDSRIKAIDRNTTWRHAFKGAIGFLFVAFLWMIFK